MLVKDEAALRRAAAQDAADHELEGTLRQIDQSWRNANLMNDADLNPCNYAAQRGRAMPDHVVEAKLLKLNANLKFVPHPKNPTKKCMYVETPDGRLDYVMAYEKGEIPENSTFSRVYQDVPDPAALRRISTPEGIRSGFHIDRADLPKSYTIPHKFDEQGRLVEMGDVIFEEGALLPNMRRDIVPYNEVIRGYRTMLNNLLLAGLITLSEAEREFGGQNKASWAFATGRRQRTTPW